MERLQRLRAIETTLERRIDELPALLSPHELSAWRGIEPRIAAVRQGLSRASLEIEQGATSEAEVRLDKLAGDTRSLFDELQQLQTVNQQETSSTLDAVEARVERALLVQRIVAIVLVAVILAIALILVWTIRWQDEERARQLERIEQANRDLDAFAGRVAHDVRNVIAPIRLAGQMLRRSPADPVKVKRISATIDRATQQAWDTMSGLLAFSRAGAPAVQGASAAVGDQLRSVLEELTPLTEQTRAEVRTEIEPDLHVGCEPSLLHAVLLNLVHNALKFLEGAPRREVLITARADGASGAIEVRDTGPGIPADAMDRIFEPFFRASASSASGCGIGLATVKRIVDAHGGAVSVASAGGAGTTFRVLLPLASPTASGAGRVAQGSDQRSSSRASA